MPTVAQGLENERATAGAGLRGVARIDFLDPATSVCSFVAENVEEATPRGIVYRFRQPSPTDALDVEVFHRDMLGFRQDGVGLPVRAIVTPGRQLAVELVRDRHGFSPTVTSAIAGDLSACDVHSAPRAVASGKNSVRSASDNRKKP